MFFFCQWGKSLKGRRGGRRRFEGEEMVLRPESDAQWREKGIVD